MKKLCIDLGYTNTRLAVHDTEGFVDIRRIRTIETRAAFGEDAHARRQRWLDWLSEEVAAIRRDWPTVEAVGLCFPGVVAADGAIWRSNTIWGNAADDLPPDALHRKLGLPVVVLNDISAAAVRYGESPEMERVRTVCVVSVSSGIGAKLYDRVARRVLLEPGGRNGELGLAVVDDAPDALTNDNGRLRGILGNYSSGVGFTRMLRRAMLLDGAAAYGASLLHSRLAQSGLDAQTMDRAQLNEIAVQCIKACDPFTESVLRASVSHLARVLHVIVLFSAPERIVLTGGFATSLGEFYRAQVASALAQDLRLLYDSDQIDELLCMGAGDDMDNLMGMAAWMDRERSQGGQSA
jgi:glucokinase